MFHWHQTHQDSLSFGGRLADNVATFMGSWKFIIIQTTIVIFWMILNIIGFVYHWDEYPFILLNLLFSTQAAYAAPIIMQSQNRQSERDRHQADADYACNLKSKDDIEQLQRHLSRLEMEKLDRIITLLEKLQSKS
jgi:uncharacterized membrane protein